MNSRLIISRLALALILIGLPVTITAFGYDKVAALMSKFQAVPADQRAFTFGPYTDPKVCFRVFRTKQKDSFCLAPGEHKTMMVRAGDSFCGTLGDEPAATCTRSPLVPKERNTLNE